MFMDNETQALKSKRFTSLIQGIEMEKLRIQSVKFSSETFFRAASNQGF